MKLRFIHLMYNLCWWLHKRYLQVHFRLLKYGDQYGDWWGEHIIDPDRWRYFWQWKGHKMEGWKP